MMNNYTYKTLIATLFALTVNGQNHLDYWNWLNIMANKSESEAVSELKPWANDEFIQDKKYGDFGFYFSSGDNGYVLSKDYSNNLVSNQPGTTLTLFVIRDNLSNLNSMVQSMLSGLYNDEHSGSYIWLRDGASVLSQGRYDANLTKEGLQIDFLELLEKIDFSSPDVEIEFLILRDKDINDVFPLVNVKVSKDGYNGYTWVLQIAGSTSNQNRLLNKMPKRDNSITCDVVGSHAYLDVSIGSSSRLNAKGLFDTGASVVSIPRILADELLLSKDATFKGKSRFSTANGLIETDIISINQIFIQGKLFKDIEAAVVNSEEVLIGQSLFKGFDWSYDNAMGKIWIK